MRIQQLIYFEKIVEKGSMNEAAKDLYVSQPSLSKAIRELELEMDITLFQRGNTDILRIRATLCVCGACLR